MNEQVFLYRTTLSSQKFIDVLHHEIDVQEEFRLISYLSDGGAVVRGIAPPENASKAFFGRIQENRFSIVENLEKRFVTPYQPILFGTLEADTIKIEVKMHPQAFPLLGLYTAFGVLLIFLGLLVSTEDPFIFTVTSIFGGLLIFFPRYRTQNHFERCLQTAIATWEQLPLELTRE